MADKKDLEKSDKASDKVADPELDELLDSALEDLTKKPSSEKTSEAAKTKNESAPSAEVVTQEDIDDPNWTEEFIRQAAQQFEANVANLLGGAGADATPENLQQNFQRMAEAAAQVMANPSSVEATPQSNDFASTISQTLQNLSLGAENLQNPFNESDILGMFGGGGPGGAAPPGGANQFLPFMQGMMQSLLSKEVLYPSLKDILDRYPAWLEEKRGILPPEEAERYEKQMNLMNEVCTELEKENDDDEESLKRERFEKVLGLMQKMQDLGQPPQDLVGEPVTPGLQFDPQGNPILPPDLNPEQCVVM